jgi:hypothetical protein
MKQLLLIIGFSIALINAQAQWTGSDSLRNFNNRFITNDAKAAFTNLRLHNLLDGMIDYIDTALAGGSSVALGVDTMFMSNDSVFVYKKNGVFRQFVIRGQQGARNIYEIPFSDGAGKFGADSNFLFDKSQGANNTRLVVGPVTVNDGGLAKINATSDNMNAAAFTSFGTGLNTIVFRRAEGTVGTPLALTEGKDLWNFSGRGYTGTFYTTSRASIYSQTTQDWTDSTHGTKIVIATTQNDSSVMRDRVTVDHNGEVYLNNYPNIPATSDTTAKPLAYGSDGKVVPMASWPRTTPTAISDPHDVAEQEVNVQMYKWEQLKSGVLSQWYDGVSIAIVNDTPCVVGGWNANQSYDTVWSVIDEGQTLLFRSILPYKVHTPGFIPNASDGYSYIIGGDYLNTRADRAKVYRTRDFRTYELRTSSSPFADRVLHAAAEKQGKLYCGGGQDTSLTYANGAFPDLYKSEDGGATWTLLSNSLTHMANNINGCFHVFNDRFVLAGGGRYDNDSTNKTFDKGVYSSFDGVSWRQEPDMPFAFQYPNQFVFDGKLWVSGGFTRTGGANADSCAFMDKSFIWHRYIPPGKPTATHAAGTYVHKDAAYFILGNTLNDIWRLKRSNTVYYEIPPSFSTRLSQDTIVRNNFGYNQHWHSDNGLNEFKFTNTGGIASYMNVNGGAFEFKPSNLFTYEFTGNGFFRIKKLRIYTDAGQSAYQFDSYYNNLLAIQGNVPGILLQGASNTLRMGVDGSYFGIGQESPSTGVRFKIDFTNGKTVIANNTTAAYDVAVQGSAVLALLSTISGFLPPVMTASQKSAISSPATGLLVFDNDSLQLSVYDGSAWRMVPYTLSVLKFLKGSLTWDAPGVSAASSTTTTLTITGAAVGDEVIVTTSDGAGMSNGEIYDAWVSGANTVTLRQSNVSGGGFDIASRTFNFTVLKH